MSHLTTFTGKNIDTNYPRGEDICIEDIAHALSLMPVHGGHTYTFYSMAQRAVVYAKLVSEKSRKTALLHEAWRAYVSLGEHPSSQDNPSISTRWHKAILEKFGISVKDIAAQEAHEVYWSMIATERRDLLNNFQGNSTYAPYPFGQLDTHPLTPDQAEYAFLKYFQD